MELVLSSQTGVVIHQTIFEFILGLLMISPIFLLGIVLIGCFIISYLQKRPHGAQSKNIRPVAHVILLSVHDAGKYRGHTYSQ